MSKESVKLFFEQVEKDEQLQERLIKVQTENQEKVQASIVKLGKETGCDFSREELQQVSEQVVTSIKQNGELDDEQLEAVSGGIDPISALVIGAIVVNLGVVGVAVVGSGVVAGVLHSIDEN